eukprot:CAMPEP_0176001694 /NCGR_PEP_ID=MMETSP0120_2-20121206/258_1 /TAXON_ID=160619 /ORGANISM="Kryptoperidinium foliaceum, Strain CCMP 1326" /LENGTH=520 /DNA_ID=CAMNT_0017334249 /DNA_START=163 /DNA_END=1725 /DNA_ORIENTATION=-
MNLSAEHCDKESQQQSPAHDESSFFLQAIQDRDIDTTVGDTSNQESGKESEVKGAENVEELLQSLETFNQQSSIWRDAFAMASFAGPEHQSNAVSYRQPSIHPISAASDETGLSLQDRISNRTGNRSHKRITNLQFNGNPDAGLESRIQGSPFSEFIHTHLSQKRDKRDGDTSLKWERPEDQMSRKAEAFNPGSKLPAKKSRKKSQASDPRWSKRFTWPEHHHRGFVAAIFDLGLREATVPKIQEHMFGHNGVSSVTIQNLLQNYRRNQNDLRETLSGTAEPAETLKSMETGYHQGSLDGIMFDDQTWTGNASDPAASTASEPEMIMLPQLSESERASDTGVALGHLIGLFLSLKQRLGVQRAAEAKLNASVSAGNSGFVSDSSPPVEDNNVVGLVGIEAARSQQGGQANHQDSVIMMRDMQSRMVFQSKMRALRQQEIDKFKSPSPCSDSDNGKENETLSPTPSMLEMESSGDPGVASRDIFSNDNTIHRKRSRSIEFDEGSLHEETLDERFFDFLANG